VNRTHKLAFSALMVSLMMILSYLEARIPVSTIPGIKLGLANCVLLLGLYWLGAGICWPIMLTRVLLSGLLFSGPMSIVYSLAGGCLSLLIMQLLRKMPGFSPVGLGMAGGAAHNLAQVSVAVLVLKTPTLFWQLALLLPVGAVMGAVTGILAAILLKRINPFNQDTPKKGM